MVTERHTAQMLAHEKLVCSAILEINSQHGIYFQYPLTQPTKVLEHSEYEE